MMRRAPDMSKIRRILKCRKGTTAVEFALVATPFFALLIAIFETGILFLAQQTLQTATTQAARLIMTGQAQAAGLTSGQFTTDVCNNAGALFNCGSIYVNVQKFSTFSSMTMLNPLTGGNFNKGSLNYNIGGPGDIMLVQVFYQWPVGIAPLGFNLSNMNGNNRLLMSTAVFRNEPY
jgi:Flp pilus assembly protein TadG